MVERVLATSALEIVEASKGLYAAKIGGQVAVKLGTRDWWPGGGWEVAQRLTPRYYPPEKAARTLTEWGAQADQWVVIEITPRRIRSMAP